MYKSVSLELIMLLAVALAIWTASISIADEIEGKTALMVLSKPVARWQFISGKFVGVIIPITIVFIILGSFFLGAISYKMFYDAKEAAKIDPTNAACYFEMVGMMPGLALTFMQALLLASIAVVISTRLPMIPNLIICVTIYVLGHMIPMMVNSSMSEVPFVAFVGNLIATVLPGLYHFNIETAISTGQWVPLSYLGTSAVYCLLYFAVMMMLALFLFEDRDLA